MILALLATLGAIVTAFVLYPVFKEAPATGPSSLDEREIELSDLIDKKAMLYDAIQDLDFEKDSGKISEDDYQTTRNDYVAQVAAIMEKIDGLAPPQDEPQKRQKPAKQEKKNKQQTKAGTLACSICGTENPAGSKFCLECGTGLEKTCASCGESLPAQAKFCNSCGEKVAS